MRLLAMNSLFFNYSSSLLRFVKACQVACKDKNNLEVGRRFRRIYEIQDGDLLLMGKVHLKIMSLLAH